MTCMPSFANVNNLTTKMADDAELSTTKNSDKNPCFVHFSSVRDVQLTSFSDISWNTALAYAEKWTIYGGEKGKIAEEFYQRIADSTSTQCTEQQQNQASTSSTVTSGTNAQHIPTKPPNAKYHRSCYSKFTDVTKAKAAEKSYMKRKTSTDLAKDTTGKS